MVFQNVVYLIIFVSFSLLFPSTISVTPKPSKKSPRTLPQRKHPLVTETLTTSTTTPRTSTSTSTPITSIITPTDSFVTSTASTTTSTFPSTSTTPSLPNSKITMTTCKCADPSTTPPIIPITMSTIGGPSELTTSTRAPLFKLDTGTSSPLNSNTLSKARLRDADALQSTSKSMIRLVTPNGETTYPFGRVEVLENSEWTTVASDSWSNEDAEVVCRMLGFQSGNAVGVPNAAFGEGKGSVSMNYVQCDGTEPTIQQCPRASGYGATHKQDASVICTEELMTKVSDSTTSAAPYGIQKPTPRVIPTFVGDQKPSNVANETTTLFVPVENLSNSTINPLQQCSGRGTTICQCEPDYTGQQCETKITTFCKDPIPNFPGSSAADMCLPHGTCMETETHAVCICQYGYNGKFCNIQNLTKVWSAERCALYETTDTVQEKISVGCKGLENCVPDNITCNVVNTCQMPVGWCLPRDEYEKYMLYVNDTLKEGVV